MFLWSNVNKKKAPRSKYHLKKMMTDNDMEGIDRVLACKKWHTHTHTHRNL